MDVQAAQELPRPSARHRGRNERRRAGYTCCRTPGAAAPRPPPAAPPRTATQRNDHGRARAGPRRRRPAGSARRARRLGPPVADVLSRPRCRGDVATVPSMPAPAPGSRSAPPGRRAANAIPDDAAPAYADGSVMPMMVMPPYGYYYMPQLAPQQPGAAVQPFVPPAAGAARRGCPNRGCRPRLSSGICRRREVAPPAPAPRRRRRHLGSAKRPRGSTGH